MTGCWPIICDKGFTGAQSTPQQCLAPTSGKRWHIKICFVNISADAHWALLQGVDNTVTEANGTRVRTGDFASKSGLDTPIDVILDVGKGLWYKSDGGNAVIILTGVLI